MGAPKQKWTPEEEAALLEGVDKYGAGKWSEILRDPDLRVKLATRSNVDLKAPGRCYRIAEIPGNSSSTGLIPKSSHVLCLPAICHSKQHSVPTFDSLRCPGDELKFNFDNEFNSSVGDEIEKHVNNLMNMNAEDASKAAADAAAKAVQEAEMLIAEAEEAFMEAEQAKEEYEAAKAYLATKNKRYRNSGKRHFDE
eukprot:TRINITY_DN2672_c0_g1_i1.p1 TRINITY_DN2672_c0_g1~~TRINITY_DN2672_c0_g1_i1.p1  ORF type:complete len:196 (-),score=57.36 TRINITY_DN2672_c0_g1_i1:254-841(-)